ncbi:MAG: hypothetical protein INR67_12710 [Jatrophihabitans endophyticus]|nr:hypothetical protein [Jatrophihabitans endophyticus]
MTSNVRAIEVGRGLWGAALLVAPRTVLENVHHLEVDHKSLVIARILGARHITQAALSGIRPSPEVLAMGVWVDVVHALSAVGLAAADRSRARAGLTDAAVASVWAGAGYRDLRGDGPTAPAHDRRRDALARFVLGIAPGGKALLTQSRHDRQRARRA